MIEKLLNLFGIHQSAMVVGVASNVVKAFETEYAQDHDAKLAAYDTLIAVLQQHRDKLVPPAPASAPAQATPPAA